MNNEIIMKCELRPCIVEGRKALFHSWQRSVDYIPPLKGKHLGGTTEYIIGIIELENGAIEKVFPEEIRFIDNKVKSYFEENATVELKGE